MNSTSSLGMSLVTLQFQTSTNLDEGKQEVQAAINSAKNTLPSILPYPRVYGKVNPADAAVLTLAVTSDALPLTRVEDLTDTRIAQKLSQVSSVRLITFSGGARPAVRVQTDTRTLNTMGLSLEDVRTAVGDANVSSAKGTIDGRCRLLRSADDHRRRLPGSRARETQRRAFASRGCREEFRGRGESARGRAERCDTRDHHQRAAAAGRERDRSRGPDRGVVATTARIAGRDRKDQRAERPHADDPRFRA